MKYLKVLILDCFPLNIIIFLLLGIPILTSYLPLLCLIYVFKFNLGLSVSKEFAYFAYQFLNNFPETSANTDLTTDLN